jgi:hypothetical protein
MPAFELNGNNIGAIITTAYRNNFGGTSSRIIMDKSGDLILKEKLRDSNNITIPFDLFNDQDHYISCGQKFISKDTLKELWIAKISLDGNIIWEKQFRTNYNSPGFLSCTKSHYNSRIAFCGSNDLLRASGSAITSHGLVVITDSLGNMIHFIEVNDLDTTTLEGYCGITEDKDANIYACGTIFPNSLNNDVVVVKVNADGKLLWRKRITSLPYNEGVIDIFYQTDGSFLLLGNSYNGDFFGDPFCFTLLYNMDTTGKINWVKRILKIYDGEVRNYVQDQIGNYIGAGTMKLNPNEDYDGYLVKFSPKGDNIWSRRINNYNGLSEQFYNIANASDGGYYLTGYSWIAGNNSGKAWIVKVDSLGCLVPGCQNVVKTKDVEEGKIKVFEFYPNPAKEVLYFLSRVTKNDNYSIRICDLQGKEVYNYSFMPVQGKQYIMEFPNDVLAGNYRLRIHDEKGKIIETESIEKL